MGVTGLWGVVHPCARPIKLETLNKKRLAVDASIWIYQFLKAVRDKEGNALRNSHVVGFFRRICKLLFVGILPVFVFDGGAPALKRQTINARKRRREGRKEDAVRTAGKLLALQVQRAAEDEAERQKREEAEKRGQEEETMRDDQLVYVDELQMTQAERVQNRRFKKKDQYHLPELETSMAEMGGPNDPRIMSLEELEAYARQFDTGEDINVYDFSKIDFDSPFFTSLPASDRYNILNAARLRSRLRMGYSKDQLDKMFPNRMEFSKFQIERVTERNELTQRLMNINGMNDDGMFGINGMGRIAGEKGKEYVLVRNEGVEGGWALGVVSSRDEGQREKPIDVDLVGRSSDLGEEEEQSDDDFEDVPIEGLNRLHKAGPTQARAPTDVQRRRRKIYASRRNKTARPRRPAPTARNGAVDEDPESLFVADVQEETPDEASDDGEQFEDVGSEDEQLNMAIAMSLQKDDDEAEDLLREEPEQPSSPIWQQRRVADAPSIKDSQGKSAAAIARTVNARAARAPVSTLFEVDSEDEQGPEQDSSLQIDETTPKKSSQSADQKRATKVQAAVNESSKLKSKFDGPLPFEKLDLGSSIFGKKVGEFQEKTAGGFQKDTEKDKEVRDLPPWFAGDLDADIKAQKDIEIADREQARKFKDDQKYQFQQPSVLRRAETNDIIDLDAPEPESQPKQIFVVDDEEEDGTIKGDQKTENVDQEDVKDADHKDMEDVSNEDIEDVDTEDVTMGDVADNIKVAPPIAADVPPDDLPIVIGDIKSHESDDTDKLANHAGTSRAADEEDEEPIDWSESDNEGANNIAKQQATNSNGKVAATLPSKSPSPDFEDVAIPDKPDTAAEQRIQLETEIERQAGTEQRITGLADQNAVAGEDDDDDFGLHSDSEDEDLMRQLEAEAQEHARFASELNQKSQQQNIADYERELKQLRTQQKKDRRDADEVTQIMITECQQLLRLFGLPYITAPMEAEAQCAELVRLGLVDGIVTDDSDCFLFGGTRIYKNMFNQAKFVECYLLPDLEKEFDLTRQKMIGIAQLLGSDYTEGLVGVGPVTALEILAEFPNLTEFRNWWTGVQEGRIPKSDDVAKPFRKKFRKTNATKLFLPPGFPDQRVEMAYLEPEVDSDPSDFQWGVPDLDALRAFLMATIGWSQERTDEVLVPVIKDMNRRQQEGTQSNITKFFAGTTGTGYAPRVRANEASKRLGGALGRMADRVRRKRDDQGGKEDGDDHAAEVEEGEEIVPAGRGGKRTRKRKSTDTPNSAEDEASSKKRKATRGRQTKAKKTAADGGKDDDDGDEDYEA